MKKTNTIKTTTSVKEPQSVITNNTTKIEMNRISNQYNEIKDYQEHLEELIHNDQIQRLNGDKRTNLMNENLNSEINNIKKLISHLSKILFEN